MHTHRGRFSTSIHLICACTTALLASAAHAQTNYVEQEPNDTADQASFFDGIIGGDTFAGTSAGSMPPSPGGVDYFRIRLATAPSSIYKHRLLVPAHAYLHMQMPVLSSCIFLRFTDAGFSDSNRSLQWYGFGRAEEVRWWVVCPPLNPNYLLTLQSEVVVPRSEWPAMPPGAFRFESLAPSTGINVGLYDATFSVIPGPQTGASITRTIPQGTYYLALATSLWNEDPCPQVTFTGASFTSGALNNAVSARAYTLRITHAAGSLDVPLNVQP